MELRTARPAAGIGRWIGIGLAVVVLSLPLFAFVLAMALVHSHADLGYFEAVAQIIPILILALAIELRYFSPQREIPEPLRRYLRRPQLVRIVGFFYAAATLFALVASEAVSLLAIAMQSSSQFTLSLTTGGLVAGAVALMVAILLPAEAAGAGS